MPHRNVAPCATCTAIIARYAEFDPVLGLWFTDLQYHHPEAHCSCAGRGHEDQDSFYSRGASKARWKESSHNYNAALDIFELTPEGHVGYLVRSKRDTRAWYDRVIGANLTDNLVWYGSPGAKFPELPHVERKDWRYLVAEGKLKLVES